MARDGEPGAVAWLICSAFLALIEVAGIVTGTSHNPGGGGYVTTSTLWVVQGLLGGSAAGFSMVVAWRSARFLLRRGQRSGLDVLGAVAVGLFVFWVSAFISATGS